MGYGQAGVSNQLARVRSHVGSLRNAFKVSDNDNDRAEGLLDFLDEHRLANGINFIRLVHAGAVATWDETTSGTLDVATVATAVVGAGFKITATAQILAADEGTVYVSTNDIDGGAAIPTGAGTGLAQEVGSANWEDTDFLGWWAKSDTTADFGTAGDLKLNIKNDGVWQTAVNVPAMLAGTNWQRLEVAITSFARNKVEAIRLEVDADVAAGEDMSVDEIVRYKFGNGYGPVYGRCQPFVITSGSTLSRGNIAALAQPGGTVAAASAAGSNHLGPVAIGGTGGADYDVAWVQVDGYSYFPLGSTVIEDKALIWFTGHKLTNDAGSTTQDLRIIAFMPGGTTYTENQVVLVKWGFRIQDGARLVS